MIAVLVLLSVVTNAPFWLLIFPLMFLGSRRGIGVRAVPRSRPRARGLPTPDGRTGSRPRVPRSRALCDDVSVNEEARVVRVRAPYALARALAATAVVLLGAASAHTWAGGTVPSGPGLALVAAVVLAGGLLVFTARGAAVGAAAGGRGRPARPARVLRPRRRAQPPRRRRRPAAATPAGRGRWWGRTSSSPCSPRPCGGPAGARRRTSSRSCCARRCPSRPAAPRPVGVRLGSSLVHLLVPPRPRAAAGGPAHLSPVRAGGPRDPRPVRPPRRTHVHPHPRAPRRASRRHRGHRPLARAPASAHVSATVSDASAGASPSPRSASPRLRGLAHDEIEIQVPESVLSVTPTRNPSTTSRPPSSSSTSR